MSGQPGAGPSGEMEPPARFALVGRRRGSLASAALASVIVVVAVAALAGAIFQASASALDARRHQAPGVLVDVGDHRLHLWCRGSAGTVVGAVGTVGRPTVVFESGLGGFSHDWVHLMDDVAAETRVCAYDRAGYGWSDSVDRSKTSDEIAGDLRELLIGGGERGPYVLVGHSLGGIHVRSFARSFPDDVAGLVLVDSAHENQASQLAMLEPLDEAQIGGLAWCRRLSPFGLLRLLGAHDATIPESLPVSDDIRSAWESRLYQNRFCGTVEREFIAIQDEISRATPPTDFDHLPVTVLSGGRGLTVDDVVGIDDITEADVDDANRVAARLQVELAALSTNSIHLIVDAGHYVHLDRPDVVIEAILDHVEHGTMTRDSGGNSG